MTPRERAMRRFDAVRPNHSAIIDTLIAVLKEAEAARDAVDALVRTWSPPDDLRDYQESNVALETYARARKDAGG